MPKVCIDAGHGTPNDPGAVNGKRREMDDTMRLTQLLDKLFRAQGWDTVLPRVDDNAPKLAVRTSMANSNKCDLYLSIHRNAFSNSAANGVEIWLHSQAPQRYKDWAADILKAFVDIGYYNRGVKLGHASGAGEYAINRDTVMPSMLLEVGFITSDGDNSLFDGKLDETANAVVRACCTFVGVAYKDVAPPSPPDKTYTLDIAKLREQGFGKIEIKL